VNQAIYGGFKTRMRKRTACTLNGKQPSSHATLRLIKETKNMILSYLKEKQERKSKKKKSLHHKI